MLGLYFSVPFCRSKCSFCNFASGVFPSEQLEEYAALLKLEITLLARAEGCCGAAVDTLYWGGGTPSLLPHTAFAEVMRAVRENFALAPNAEHTIEVAPGTLTPAALAAWAAAGVNRISFGVQSFQDVEVRAVGRLHSRNTVYADLERARAAGFSNLSLDLIAGLPHQTPESWRNSVQRAIASGVPHLSIYMLEVDEDSRLGNELLAGGARYHAHAVPDDDVVADAYEWACPALETAGLAQYEISNFARSGFVSRHNERYWLRQPYLGFGLDAHSFRDERRWCNPDQLSAYQTALRHAQLSRGRVERLSENQQAEERRFLGLRRSAGILADPVDPRLAPHLADGLLVAHEGRVALTPRGRLLSNRVFADLLN